MIRIFFILLFLLLIFLSACDKLNRPEYNIDVQSCNSCGRCLQICPVDAIEFGTDGKAFIDQTKCNQCGQCITVCPQDAIY